MSKLFNNDEKIKELIAAELKLISDENSKGLNVPNVFDARILERKKLLLTGTDNAKQYFNEKAAYLETIQASLEQRFKDDYKKFKDSLGIKKAKELTLKSVASYKTLLLEGAQYLFPDILDSIAERTIIAEARKNIQ